MCRTIARGREHVWVPMCRTVVGGRRVVASKHTCYDSRLSEHGLRVPICKTLAGGREHVCVPMCRTIAGGRSMCV